MEKPILPIRKVLADFSYAAGLAALIGITIGGAALSFVWLLDMLDR